MTRDIPEHHVPVLHQLAAIPETDLLPEKLINKYWANAIVANRCGWSLSNETLVRICVECGYGKLTEAESHPDVAAQWFKGTLKKGTPVKVNWREEILTGKIMGVNGKRECVVLMDSGEERTLKPEQVAVAA